MRKTPKPPGAPSLSLRFLERQGGAFLGKKLNKLSVSVVTAPIPT